MPGNPAFHFFNMHQSQIYILSVYRSFKQAFIYAGIVDDSAGHACFVYIHLRPVKAALIIDYAHHKFYRIIYLKVETLVTLHRIGSRMRLTEGITGKGFELTVNFPRKLLRMTKLTAGDEEIIL